MNVAQLRALSRHMADPKKDDRYYLAGVYLESNLAVATNGHHLAAVCTGAVMRKPIIVPADTVRALIKGVHKSRSLGTQVNFEGSWVASTPKVRIPFEPIDAEYPNWRSVMRAAFEAAPVDGLHHNPEYAAIFAQDYRELNLVNDERYGMPIPSYREGGYLVYAWPDFAGVLMARRETDADASWPARAAPTWLKA